ncbi:MAG: TolC family protein [Bacteroidota bacterium]|nr:TolC family protein [Bacteroidota bacterium]
MRRITLSAIYILLSACCIISQNHNIVKLSLQECLNTAINKNAAIRTAILDQQKSQYKIEQTKSALFPQVNVNGNFSDNLQLPVTVIPGDFLGKPGSNYAIKMGSTYSASASLTIKQELYNQTKFTAIKLAKKDEALQYMQVQKSKENLTYDLSKLYFLSLITDKQKSLDEENIARTQRLKEITQTLVTNGLKKTVDYDRVCVNLENLRTDLSNTEATLDQQQNMIKYMLQLPLDTKLILTDSIEMPFFLSTPAVIDNLNDQTDIKILEMQKERNLLNQKKINRGYLPTLSFTGQYEYQGLRQSFGNYFKSSDENRWYPSSYVGVSLSIPIFDGMDKRSQARQAKAEYQQSVIKFEDTKQKYSVDYKNAVNNFLNQQENVKRQKGNVLLAEKVYQEATLQYKQGEIALSALLQDDMDMNNAQVSYLKALYDLKVATLDMITINGEIKNLTNK